MQVAPTGNQVHPRSGTGGMSTVERGIERERLERVARLYSSNDLASQVLGITARSFSRLCRRFGVETPYARKRRRLSEARRSDR